MNRNIKTEAIVLQSKRSGDIHRNLTLLTPELGIISATAFGVRKGSSRLSGRVGQFVSGQFFLYYNPVRGSYKIDDVEPENFYPDITQDMNKFYTASFWAELMLHSYGSGGDYRNAFTLSLDFFSVLNTKVKIDMLIIQALWRFLIISGLKPDLVHCGVCGKRYLEDAMIYLDSDNVNTCCDSCRRSFGDSQECIYPGARKLLLFTEAQALEKAVLISISSEAGNALKNYLLHVIDDITEGSLRTLKSGLI